MQPLDPIADCSQHAFDLVVFALCQSQPQVVRVCPFDRRRTNRLRMVVQHHPPQQPRQLYVVQRVFGDNLVHFGDVVTW